MRALSNRSSIPPCPGRMLPESLMPNWRFISDSVTGEASAADVGIAGGKGEGLIFRKGEILYKVPQERLVDALMEEIEKL